MEVEGKREGEGERPRVGASAGMASVPSSGAPRAARCAGLGPRSLSHTACPETPPSRPHHGDALDMPSPKQRPRGLALRCSPTTRACPPGSRVRPFHHRRTASSGIPELSASLGPRCRCFPQRSRAQAGVSAACAALQTVAWRQRPSPPRPAHAPSSSLTTYLLESLAKPSPAALDRCCRPSCCAWAQRAPSMAIAV